MVAATVRQCRWRHFQDEPLEDLLECLSNSKLSVHFKEFGNEVGMADAKSLEDVYKSHLENTSEWAFSSCLFNADG